MNRRYFFWGLGVAFLVVFLSLLGVQYFYFARLDRLHKLQTKQLAHLALQRVAQEIETRELVRYLNQELNKTSQQNSKLIQALKDIRQRGVRDARIVVHSPSHIKDASLQTLVGEIDTLALTDKIMSAFLDNHEFFDEYILRNLYRVYSYDSIPQLVNPRLLRERLRYQLDQVGVTELFSVSLCDADGLTLYQYTQPGMVRSRSEGTDDTIIQPLFVNIDSREQQYNPYISVQLDFRQSKRLSMELILPGVGITLFVFLITIFTTVLLYRQLSFQEMKSNFVNNMTHELKTPISSIQLVIEQMQRTPQLFEERFKRNHYMTIMEAEVHRLKSLIDRVLQLSIYDRRNVPTINLREISVDEILLGAMKIFSMRITVEASGGLLDLQHDAENTWIMASETHMTNVLYNLLENAIKYRSLERDLRIVLRTYNTEGGDLVIEVEDNGVGISKSDTKNIFKRFYRVSDGLKHDVKGYGLGLAYVLSVVRQFRGTIVAIPKQGGGLVMKMTFPTINA